MIADFFLRSSLLTRKLVVLSTTTVSQRGGGLRGDGGMCEYSSEFGAREKSVAKNAAIKTRFRIKPPDTKPLLMAMVNSAQLENINLSIIGQQVAGSRELNS